MSNDSKEAVSGSDFPKTDSKLMISQQASSTIATGSLVHSDVLLLLIVVLFAHAKYLFMTWVVAAATAVGKVSIEWLASEKTKVVGTFPPKKRGWTGYVEKDTVESSSDGAENTALLETSNVQAMVDIKLMELLKNIFEDNDEFGISLAPWRLSIRTVSIPESIQISDKLLVYIVERLLPKNAVLSNLLGSLWHVIVDYIDGRVLFLNGWKKFVGDNSIECGDLLIFRYNGQCGFSVKIFGQDACEKIESRVNDTLYMNKVKLEKDEKEKVKDEETKENDNDNEDCDDHDGDDNDYEDYIGGQEEDSTKEEAIKNCTVGKQSVGNIEGSKKRDAVTVEGGSKRIDIINVEAEEEESTTKNSRARIQSGGNNGRSKKMAAVKVEPGSFM
ncbi:hypothetical protein LWI29_010627 [Acer saccharum]|uniref:TF-B3 domain-containing protein n=1 Tax=Acer saccharum TaxID=4024 RepID=A0AA39T135_ACESA|nr:hypothetical protein LWI29_010627 [Acer saccharum]